MKCNWQLVALNFIIFFFFFLASLCSSVRFWFQSFLLWSMFFFCNKHLKIVHFCTCCSANAFLCWRNESPCLDGQQKKMYANFYRDEHTHTHMCARAHAWCDSIYWASESNFNAVWTLSIRTFTKPNTNKWAFVIASIFQKVKCQQPIYNILLYALSNSICFSYR